MKSGTERKKKEESFSFFYFLDSMWQDLGQYVNACVREEKALRAGSEHQTAVPTARELGLYGIRLLYGKAKIWWCWKVFIPSAQFSRSLAVILSWKQIIFLFRNFFQGISF